MAYIRKTEDVFYILGFYPGYGWEEETAETTREEAKQRLREYRENQPEYSHKIIKKREIKQALTTL